MTAAPVQFPGPRRPTRRVNVGPVGVGGDAPVSVQSMTKTDTRNARATAAQVMLRQCR